MTNYQIAAAAAATSEPVNRLTNTLTTVHETDETSDCSNFKIEIEHDDDDDDADELNSKQLENLDEIELDDGQRGLRADGKIANQSQPEINYCKSGANTDVEAATKTNNNNGQHHKANPNSNIDRQQVPNGNGPPNTKTTPAPRREQDKPNAPRGSFRHIVALLALSSIVLANTNRQAYNQALSRMVRTRGPVAPVLNANNDTSESIEDTSNLELNGGGSSPPPFSSTTFSSLDKTSAGVGHLDTTTSTPELDDVVVSTPMLEQADLRGADMDHNQINGEDDDLYDWDGKQISILQGAFALGYMPFMIPGGRLSEIYGAKWVIFLSGFGSAICSLFTPFLASYSFTLLVGSRVLMGICQTGVSPALYALLTRWLAPDESSVYLAMIKVGVMIGFMLGSLVNGFLSWRMSFYLVGLISLLWSVMWAYCVTSHPEEHKFIKQQELAYIQQSLGRKISTISTNYDDMMSSESTKKKKKKKKATNNSKKSAPWLKIITSPVVLAFIFTKFTVKLSTDTQSMQLPMFLKNVLKVSDQLNGPLNGANFAIQAIFTGLVAWTAKEMIVRKSFGFTKTGVRRLFQGINNLGMGLGYLLISMNMGSLVLACASVMLISISSMFGSGGEAVIPVDLTKEYSASIMAIANSFANLSGIVLPPIVALILNNEMTDAVRWNYVWYTISGLVVSGGLVFGLFVRAEMQNFEQDDDNDDDAGGAGDDAKMNQVDYDDHEKSSRTVAKEAAIELNQMSMQTKM